MKEINDGGPAFPVTYQHEDKQLTTWEQRHPGMTLRDWFAGMALQGLLVNTPNGSSAQRVCKEAFGFADLMLAERAKS